MYCFYGKEKLVKLHRRIFGNERQKNPEMANKNFGFADDG
jgi:hypothetical protein